jgi:hypothetical protein
MLSRKVITLVIYLLIISLVFAIQPYIIFSKDGTIKRFGLYNDEETTVIPFFLILPIFAILAYLMVLVLEVINT